MKKQAKQEHKKDFGRKVKWIKKALSWCVTTFPGGVQKQEWTTLKP